MPFAPKRGREVVLQTASVRNGALFYGLLLSLPAATDFLVPAIEAAIDGDLTIEVLTA